MSRLGWPLGQPVTKVDISPPEWRDTSNHENRMWARTLFSHYRKRRLLIFLRIKAEKVKSSLELKQGAFRKF